VGLPKKGSIGVLENWGKAVFSLWFDKLTILSMVEGQPIHLNGYSIGREPNHSSSRGPKQYRFAGSSEPATGCKFNSGEYLLAGTRRPRASAIART